MHPRMIKEKIFDEKHTPHARFFMKNMRRRPDLYSNKMRRILDPNPHGYSVLLL